eukprot:CAMPEP_0204636720 /NCGR_PEP_ID=MMETSP0717-20131115/34684_1 /ASSEMBLY_ACC=CAM_ASM_000666 /TAXON_ID=230516 /ORGANISM="Chaetoceros curvisetus" /LENGTH=111 /DNA_ID=CAMNT_0051655853 /DNA_START=191 /DNA_END=526 /DNA_ORIENTATION=-
MASKSTALIFFQSMLHMAKKRESSNVSSISPEPSFPNNVSSLVEGSSTPAVPRIESSDPVLASSSVDPSSLSSSLEVSSSDDEDTSISPLDKAVRYAMRDSGSSGTSSSPS